MQVARESHVLLTQVGTQLAGGTTGKHTCLGRVRCQALTSPSARIG